MMPTTEEILVSLETITNDWRILAILWHIYFAVFVLVLILGVRPFRRTTGLLLVLPLLSVSTLAWGYGNPFNSIFFGIVGVVLIFISLKLPRKTIRIGTPWLAVIGVLMAGFGWVYPNFLTESEPLQYLYAAPIGLIPCPTILIVIGLSLVLGGLGSRGWCLTLAVIALFYGTFGALKLGVLTDLTLFAGGFLLLYVGLSQRSEIGLLTDK